MGPPMIFVFKSGDVSKLVNSFVIPVSPFSLFFTADGA